MATRAGTAAVAGSSSLTAVVALDGAAGVGTGALPHLRLVPVLPRALLRPPRRQQLRMPAPLLPKAPLMDQPRRLTLELPRAQVASVDEATKVAAAAVVDVVTSGEARSRTSTLVVTKATRVTKAEDTKVAVLVSVAAVEDGSTSRAAMARLPQVLLRLLGLDTRRGCGLRI